MQNSAAFSVYKSSAGSGKTYTLIQSYLTLALSTESASYYQSILAITFTNKAANEMKERVLGTLEKMAKYPNAKEAPIHMMEYIGIQNQISLEEVAQRAQNTHTHILHHYHLLSVMTIDKFSLKIVQTFAKDLNLPMGVGVELDAQKIKTEITEHLIEDLDDQKAEYRLLIDFIQQNLSANKDWDIRQALIDFSGNILYGQDLDFIKTAAKVNTEDIIKYTQKKRSFIKETWDELVLLAEKIKAHISASGIDDKEFSSTATPKYVNSIAQKEFPKADKQIYNQAFTDERLFSKTKIKNGENAQLNDTLVPLMQELIEKARASKGKLIVTEKILEQMYFVGLISKLQSYFAQYKLKHNTIHISEVEDAIHQIVSEDPIPYIYERVGSKFNHLLIDEFQDTSTKQWANLLPLLDHHLSENNYNMVVGDGKQSIYRFRGGDVNQFNNLPKLDTDTLPFAAERQENIDQFYTPLNLETNYRSTTTVVEFNNELMERLVPIFEKDERIQNIYDGVRQKIANPAEGYVELNYWEPSKKKEETEVESITKEEQVNRFTLQRIMQCIDDGYDYRDIAILDRTNKTLKEIAAYLSEMKVPIVSSDSLLLQNSPEVELIIHAMKCLSYPLEKQYAAQWAKAFCKLTAKVTFGELIEIIADERNFWPKLEQKSGVKFIELGTSLTAYELFEKLIRIFGLNQHSNTFLSSLGEWMFQSGNKYNNNLDLILQTWKDKKDKLSVSTPEDMNAVQLLSIHRSKGLEFPVVIAPKLEFSSKYDAQKWVPLKDHDMPIARVKLSKAIEETEWAPIYEQEVNDVNLDELNSFYVLMTRPVERFYGQITKKHGGAGLEKHVWSLVQSMEGYDDELKVMQRGSLQPKKKTEQEKNTTEEIPSFYSSAINNRLNLNLTHPTNATLSAQQLGDVIHEIMAQVYTASDVETAWKMALNTLILDPSEKDEIKSSIEHLVNHPELKHLYTSETRIYNERDFITLNGDIIRPDRINIFEEQIEITDYKTGVPNLEHQLQLQGYIQQLSTVFSQKIKGRLVYLSPFNIVEI